MADPEYSALPESEGPPAVGACGCGACRDIAPQAAGAGQNSDQQPLPPARGTGEGPGRLLLICPTCDEPFEPEFPRRCEWCGHEFEDGYEVEWKATVPDEPITGRAIAVMLALAALAVALSLYFIWLV